MHLITPMTIYGGQYCCQPSLDGRTTGILYGDAEKLDTSKWRLFHETLTDTNPVTNPLASSDHTGDGSVTFGVACGTGVTFAISGQVETIGTYDNIYIFLNDELAYTTGSHAIDSDFFNTQEISDQVTIPISGRACGNIFYISGSTFDSNGNNDVYFDVEVTSID